MIKYARKHGYRGAATLAVTALGLIGTGCGAGEDSSASSGGHSTVTIGVSVPLTGPSALIGQPERNGFQMAADAINKAGGIDGHKLKLEVQDQGADNTTALNAFNRLSGDSPLAVVGFPVSTQAFAIAPQLDRAGVPALVSGSTPTLAQASQWMFNFHVTDDLGTTAAVQYAVNKLHAKRFAILRITGEFGTGAQKTVTAALDKAGLKLVADQQFETGSKDLSAQAEKIARAKPDMIFVFGQQSDYIVAANALGGAQVKAPLMIVGLQPNTLSKMNTSSIGTVYTRTQCLPAASKDAKARAWAQQYQTRFNSEPPEYAASAYDGLMVLAAAIRTAGTDDPSALRDALSKAPQHRGVCGLEQGAANRNLVQSVIIAKADNGKFVPLTEITS